MDPESFFRIKLEGRTKIFQFYSIHALENGTMYRIQAKEAYKTSYGINLTLKSLDWRKFI